MKNWREDWQMAWDINEHGHQVMRLNVELATQQDCDRLIRGIRIMQPLLSRRRAAVEADFGLPDSFGKMVDRFKNEAAFRAEVAEAL